VELAGRKGKNMSNEPSPQSVMDNFNKRQRMLPFLIGGLAVVLVVSGIIILVTWFAGPNAPALFATKTPTSTSSPTATATVPSPTPSNTPLPTDTPEPTATATPSGPFEYEIKSGDTCWDLASRFNTDVVTIIAINNFPAGTCPLQPGAKILIPAPGQSLPTPTPIPSDLPRGTRIQYTIQSGDTLAIIASKFNTTREDIIRLNPVKLKDPNRILVGDVITVAVNIVTPTPTRGATSTPRGTLSITATATP
jgi:LysM repeat protein